MGLAIVVEKGIKNIIEVFSIVTHSRKVNSRVLSEKCVHH